MKKATLSIMFLLGVFILKAQNKNAMVTVMAVDSDKIFLSVDTAPEFPGGLKEFYKFLGSTIVYPKIARRNNTQGRVIVQFIIERDGSLTDIKVVRGVSKEIDEEAVRALNLCPKWSPGIQNGKAVRCSYTVPISFSLTK